MATLIYPKAQWTPSGIDGGAMLGGTPRAVWHTTETHPSAFFTAKTFYHLQIREWGGQVHIRQFIDLSRASRALRREDSVQTNRRGTFCPNLCIVGYAKDSAALSDAMVNEIGELVAFCHRTMDIPPEFLTFRGGEAYGYNGKGRLSATAWEKFSGHCGHQHVYRNTHWDPGRFPVDRILSSLEPLGGPAVQPPNWATAATQWHIDNGIYTESRPEDLDEDIEFHRQSVFRHRFYQRVVAPALRSAGDDGKGAVALSETRDLKAKLNQATR